MLIDVTSQLYRKHFSTDPHPYISELFVELNKNKADRIVRLIEDNEGVSIGLIAGIVNNTLKSPFSAPFGGFHFDNEDLFIGEFTRFLSHLKEYVFDNKLKGAEITLPPDIYHHSINAKFINSFIRNGFSMAIPEITNWVNLNLFDGNFLKRSVRKSLRGAARNNLTFNKVSDENMKLVAYEIVAYNREWQGRKIHMTFTDLLEIGNILPVDFFIVKDSNGEDVGSAIFYRGNTKIAQGIFWGDTLPGRLLNTMDFLVLNLYNYYKEIGFEFLDLGISTEYGSPNEGLIRFKEIHNCTSSLRFTFSWVSQKQSS